MVCKRQLEIFLLPCHDRDFRAVATSWVAPNTPWLDAQASNVQRRSEKSFGVVIGYLVVMGRVGRVGSQFEACMALRSAYFGRSAIGCKEQGGESIWLLHRQLTHQQAFSNGYRRPTYDEE